LPPPRLQSGQSSGYQRRLAEISGSLFAPPGFGIKAHPRHPWSACPERFPGGAAGEVE
jgi:hypothetical protein